MAITEIQQLKNAENWFLNFKSIQTDRGFTLVELIVVTAVLGVLATLVVPAYDHFVGKVRVTRCVAEIRGLEKEINAFTIDRNTLPASLADIGWDTQEDPWGNLYQYRNILNGDLPRQDQFLNNLNGDFDVFSVGPDGLSAQSLGDASSLDDVVRAGDGGWVGQADNF